MISRDLRRLPAISKTSYSKSLSQSNISIASYFIQDIKIVSRGKRLKRQDPSFESPF